MTQGTQDPAGEAPTSPAKADEDLVQALNVGASHYRAGRLGQAKAVFEDILRRHPGSAGARHFLGLVAHAEGNHDRAIQLLEEAIEQTGTIAFFHGNLAEVYRSLGRNEEAVACCQRALDLIPVYPEALNTWGAVLYEEGNFDEAEANLRRAVEFKPDFAEAHANLGNVHRARGLHEKAVKAYERALKHDPRLLGARMALGNALRSQGRLEDAVACFREALDRAPKVAGIWSNLGVTLRRLERNDEALECFRHAVRLQPRLAEAHTNLGTCLLVMGDMPAAVESYKTAFEVKWAPTLGKPEPERQAQWRIGASDRRFVTTTAAKLRHDIEQFRYLQEKGHLPTSFGEQIARYEEVLRDFRPAPSDRETAPLTTVQREKIFDTYNKAVFVARAPALAESPVNRALDTGAIEDDYFANAPGVAYFDDFLVPGALESLRRFCLESTIWFDADEYGYLGAYLSDGFYSDLLFQIAEDMRRALPRVFGDRPLRQMWAYKYDSQLKGIDRHADAAAVNVNFWITPDEANLDPDSGGLIVYTRETPMDWKFEKYNRDQTAIEEILEGSDSLTIPHRQNRAIVFNSNLVHKTDVIHFADGYENRRINITMLFGQRGDAPKMP